MPEGCRAEWAILATFACSVDSLAGTHAENGYSDSALMSALCTTLTDYNMFLPNIPGFAAAIFTTVSCYALASLKVRTSCCWGCLTVGVWELSPNPFCSSTACTRTCSLGNPSMQLLGLLAAVFLCWPARTPCVHPSATGWGGPVAGRWCLEQ